MKERRLSRDDAALSDFVSTILLVALVVTAGGALTVVVGAKLSAPSAPAASMSLSAPDAGDAALFVAHRSGAALPLDGLRVTLARNDTGGEVPRGTWGTPDPMTLRPGDRLRIPLAPAAAPGERFHIQVIHSEANTVLAELRAVTRGAAADLGAASLTARFERNTTTADGATAALLTANVSHPAGALAIARVVADLSNITSAAGSAPVHLPLGDAGTDGDAVGGDGTWSLAIRLAPATPRGHYNVTVNATDLAGRVVASVRAPIHVVANGTAISGGICYGCIVQDGSSANAGTRLVVPTSANVTRLTMHNWTWDRLHPARLDDDYVLFRIVGGGVGWTAMVKLEEFNGQAYAIRFHVWTDAHETVYEPRNFTGNARRLPLENLTMDLLRPVESLQWVRVSGSADPLALYQHANVGGNPALVITFMGQDQTTGNALASMDTGIYSFDLGVS